MMSKNEVTSGEKDTIRRSKEPTVITTASGQAESTEEATVYFCGLGVFVTMMLLEDSPAVLSLVSLCEEMGYYHGWKRGESPSMIKDEKLQAARLRTMCQLWQFQKNLVSPMSLRRRLATDCESQVPEHQETRPFSSIANFW